jgi:Ca2+-binding RTX toxin-like protein
MIWNPGDGNAINEGGAGIDTIEVNGGNASETFTITANGSRVRFDRTNPAPFNLDIGTSENLFLNANGGDDSITASNGLATLIALTLDGGDGNDTITGGDGSDRLTGGNGNDTLNGGKGADFVAMGAGDDTFVWNPGDGSDTVEGGDGLDEMVFNGAAIDETFTISANGSRVRLTRDIGLVAMDLNGVEGLELNGRGGSDTFIVNDLTGTDMNRVDLDLGNLDGHASSVIVNGTNDNDVIAIAGDANGLGLTGLAAEIAITGAEGDRDSLTINGLAGDDVINASGLDAGAILFTAIGGEGDDELVGSAAPDVLLGGYGDDILIGGPGEDVLDGGPGDNVLFQ